MRWAVPIASSAYRRLSPRLRRVSERFEVSGYDDVSVGFRGGDLPELLNKNYEKSLRHLWKAEVLAPWLGIHDASPEERRGDAPDAERRTSAAVDELRAQLETEAAELEQELSIADIRAEFEAAYTPEQRNAICRVMDLIVHGEAYALYTSVCLTPIVRGTGAKMGMAMQVMEEAKHYLVLRALMQGIGDVKPLPDTARIILETIARQRGYGKLFGMNILVESLATSLFAQFADAPGLRHVLGGFHRDEARHAGFPRTYFNNGGIPHEVTHGFAHRANRTRLVLMCVPIIWEMKPHLDVLGIDTFEFFGRFLTKVGRIAESSGLPLLWPHDEVAAVINQLFNLWREEYEPEKWTGFIDYTSLNQVGTGRRQRVLLANEREFLQ